MGEHYLPLLPHIYGHKETKHISILLDCPLAFIVFCR